MDAHYGFDKIMFILTRLSEFLILQMIILIIFCYYNNVKVLVSFLRKIKLFRKKNKNIISSNLHGDVHVSEVSI